ncbi:MAG: ATP-binding cassette domain-containing protein, partial [bacterium]|nr:ATP-binding cassette domain-containing protein [bacterium]
MNNKVLEVTELGKVYRQGDLSVDVLHAVNLNVGKGERHAVIGASGAGKSTLLHILGGLDHATSGSVRVMGQALENLSQKKLGVLRNRHLGFIYQFHHLLP